MTSYNRALEITGCESIETTLRTRILFLRAGTFIRISSGRLPKRIAFGNLEGAVWRGRMERRKSGPIAYRAFGITGTWKATASKA